MPEAELHKDYWHTVKDVNLFLYIIFLFTLLYNFINDAPVS